MEWKKLGLIYVPDGSLWWAKSHAMIPTPVLLDSSTIRVYITCCDESGIGRIGYVDVNASDPTEVVDVCAEPLLDIGKPGTFDENGALVCSVLKTDNDDMFLYYAGFELGTKIRYRLLTGLAVSEKGSNNFIRVKQVPVLERSDQELFFRGGPFALQNKSGFEMWYVAGSEWEEVRGVEKPVYEIRHITSMNGVDWPAEGRTCIKIERKDEHGFGRPYVADVNDKRLMFYSVRRKDLDSYRLGYAELSDENNWVRKDDEVGIDVSAEGWDSEMICYAAVFTHNQKCYMFYNGNNFGQSGFGVAILK